MVEQISSAFDAKGAFNRRLPDENSTKSTSVNEMSPFNPIQLDLES
jgi:hypothetical protein